MFGKNRDSPVAPQNPSQINEDVRIRDTINVSEPFVLAGQLDGRVLGSIVAEEVFLSATAHFEGQLYCQDVAVDDGAYVNAKFTKEPVTNG